jgi:uncharacterized protein (DUF885 family)
MTDTHAASALADLAQRAWETILDRDPIWATQVGDDRFIDRLPRRGLTARDDAASAFSGLLRDARSLRGPGLDREARTTLDVIEGLARTEVERVTLGADLLDAVDHLLGAGSLLERLLEVHPLESSEDADALLRRLEAVPEHLGGVSELMELGVARGMTAARVVCDRTSAQIERLLDRPAEDWAVVAAMPGSHRDRAVGVVRAHARPAYAEFHRALLAYRERARDDIGLVSLPNGDAIYASRVRAWTGLELDSADIHEIGLTELESIRAEQQATADRLGYVTARDAREAARRRTRASSREGVLREAERLVGLGWEASARWFGRMPSANCAVRPIEASREGDILDYYIQAPADGSRPGTFYVSARPGRSLYQLASTAFHESSPGHHLQIALEQEAVERPMVLRFAADLVGGAFWEGWGLYAERLADEMGLFADDLERLGMLELQALRAARLVIDTGIHALGWSRERAIDFLEDAWADNRDDAQIEIDRYIALPGQALCYTLGQREIHRWRLAAAEVADPGFSLPDFHDRLLALGSLPLPTIDRELTASFPRTQ